MQRLAWVGTYKRRLTHVWLFTYNIGLDFIYLLCVSTVNTHRVKRDREKFIPRNCQCFGWCFSAGLLFRSWYSPLNWRLKNHYIINGFGTTWLPALYNLLCDVRNKWECIKRALRLWHRRSVGAAYWHRKKRNITRRLRGHLHENKIWNSEHWCLAIAIVIYCRQQPAAIDVCTKSYHIPLFFFV